MKNGLKIDEIHLKLRKKIAKKWIENAISKLIKNHEKIAKSKLVKIAIN